MSISADNFKVRTTDDGIYTYKAVYRIGAPMNLELWFEYQDRDSVGLAPCRQGYCSLIDPRALPLQFIIVDVLEVEDWQNPIPSLLREIERIKAQLVSRLLNLQPKHAIRPTVGV